MDWLRRMMSKTAAMVGHDAIRQADPYSFAVAHRRLAWMLRLSVMTNVCLVFVAVSMASAISTMMPLKEIRVALLKTAPSDDRVFEVQPLEQSTPGFDLVMEAAARRFVKSTLEIDETTQNMRFEDVQAMVEEGFWTNWLAEHRDRIIAALDDGLKREIIIETTHRMEQRPEQWLVAVDFRQIDRFDGEVSEEKHLRAYLSMTVRPQQVRAANLFDNPLGVIVLDMTVKERGSANKEQQTEGNLK